MSEIIWCLSFSAWLISLNIMFSRSIHAVTKVKFPSFLWPSSIPWCKCPIVVLSTHLLMDPWAASVSWPKLRHRLARIGIIWFVQLFLPSNPHIQFSWFSEFRLKHLRFNSLAPFQNCKERGYGARQACFMLTLSFLSEQKFSSLGVIRHSLRPWREPFPVSPARNETCSEKCL